jgi:hypothetical protein
MYGQEKEEVVIGDNNTVLLFVRSFVRSLIYILTVEYNRAITDKFEEIKKKKRKLRARSYNSFGDVGGNVIHIIFLK